MTSITTPQGFVRALKAESDPPTPGGHFKIDIARQIWDDTSFYIPNKSEVIAEWIFTKFSKERGREFQSNSLFDLRFWTLLHDVMSAPKSGTTDIHIRPLKLWLPLLLDRISFCPTLCSWLVGLEGIEASSRRSLSLIVYNCLEIVWPSAFRKLNLENLSECFVTFLTAFSRIQARDASLARIGTIITLSYRQSMGNSVNKKKVCLAFMHNHMPQWLQCINHWNSEEPYQTTLDCAYQAGVDTIFNLETLRQVSESKPEISVVDSILAVVSLDLELCAILPRLFASFIDVVKRHRGALTSQGSAQLGRSANAGIQAYVLPFLVSCLSLLDTGEQTLRTWTPKVALLSLVSQENIFDRGHTEAQEMLSHVVDQALIVLEANTADSDLETYVVRSLSVLCRIDYNLIIPALPSIIPKVSTSRLSIAPVLVFLDLVLEYYIKTRTLDAYIKIILSALLPNQAIAVRNLRNHYESSLSSPLFDSAHLGSLSKAIQNFLTSSQILVTSESTYRFLESAMDGFDVAQPHTEESSSKRRKATKSGTENVELSPAHWAVGYSLSTDIATIVFSSLPMATATEATRQAICDHLTEVRAFTQLVITSYMKTLRKQRGDGVWALSTVTAASFRLQYALDTSNIIPLPPFDEEKLCQRILKVMHDESLFPGLLIELFRFLLKVALQREQTASQRTFDHMLAYLKHHFGKPPRVGTNGIESPLVIVRMILQRWLHVIESFASEEQLERLLRLILSANVTSDNTGTILRPQTLLLPTFQSAQFLELPRFRVALMSVFNQTLSRMDPTRAAAVTTSPIVATYQLLVALPIEYLSRTTRSESIRQALVLDRYITTLDDQLESKFGHLAIIRTFLSRIFSRVNSLDQSVETVCRTLNHLISLEGRALSHDDLMYSTLYLMSFMFLDMFKRSENAVDEIRNVLQTLMQIDFRASVFSFRTRSIICMVDVLELNFKFTSFSEKIQTAIVQFHQTLSNSMESHMLTITANTSFKTDPRDQEDVLTLWRSLLSLRKWIVITTRATAFGRPLVKKLAANMGNNIIISDDKICAATLAILIEEFNLYPETDRRTDLRFMLAAYVSLYGALKPSTRQQVDRSLSKVCAGLSISEFSHVLELVYEALRTHGPEKDRVSMLHISAVILYNHPRSTLKQMQNFMTNCIHTFLGWHGLIEGPIELRIHTLEFLAQHCVERPAVLRLGDMGGIWSLLTRFLSGSRDHDGSTTTDVFHKITNTTSALVRLRRDLVVHTLPHLCDVLRRLLLLLRAVRPNLGTKQTLLVTDTQPRWLNASQPLGLNEAKALARLLETLTIKSVVRNNASAMETHKAESLAKPLSKHAAYVLKAYITAVNDPLCLLPLEQRKELQRGLYALCSTMSDHARDAMMVGSLDAGGKLTMKALWKEYEKQRYVGKG